MREAFALAMFGALLLGCGPKQGDFTVKMPKPKPVAKAPQGHSQAAGPREPVTLEVRLIADKQGNLVDIYFSGQRLVVQNGEGDLLYVLRQRVRELLEQSNSDELLPQDYEAEIHADPGLRYSFQVGAIEALASYWDDNGKQHRLIERIRFAPPRQSTNSQ